MFGSFLMLKIFNKKITIHQIINKYLKLHTFFFRYIYNRQTDIYIYI